MSKLSVLLLLVAAFVAAPATAQVALTGTFRIEKLASPPSCSPNATHKVKCTDIHLFGDTGVDLSAYEGKAADVEYSVQLASCVTLKVTKIGDAASNLRISPFLGGRNRLGDRVNFTTRAPLLSIVPFMLAGKAGFVPLGAFGTLSSDPLTLQWIKNDIALLGFTTSIIQIPNDPTLVGVEIIQQSAYIAVSNSQIEGRMLNVDCFTIQAR